MKALFKPLREVMGEADRGWFWIPLAAFFAAVIADITLPGLYMDAVNPDYMVPRMLGEKGLSSIWIMPGNLLFERWPLLPSLYHGSGMAWMGLPFYSVLGTDIYSIRLVHGIYGALILAAGLLLLRRLRVWWWLIGLIGLALALDPAFVFSFRTQFYITAAPMALMIASIYCLFSSDVGERKRPLMLSGLLVGLAIFGYFIYAFFVPAMAIAVYCWQTQKSSAHVEPVAAESGRRRVFVWSAGLMIGLLPYAVGFLLIAISKGSVASLVEYVGGLLGGLEVTKTSTGSMGRFEALWVYFLALVNHASQSSYWSLEVKPLYGANIKAFALLFLPLLFWAIAEWRTTVTRSSRLLLGLSVSFFVAASVFGARLGSHHFVPVFVLLHLAMAVALCEALRPSNALSWIGVRASLGARQWVGVVAMLALCYYNLNAQLWSRSQLRQTGGVGLYTDAINRLTADINANHRSAIHFMPDWGLWMPAVFLTGGKVDIVADENDRHARWLLCNGRAARWVLINGDIVARTAAITARLNWTVPKTEVWTQRDGRRAFDVVTYQPLAEQAERQRRCQSS